AFTHYDLHLLNIIVKKDPHIIHLPNGREIETRYSPVIIDYGSVHVKIDGIDYGRYLPEGYIENEEFWAHDVFKILSMVYDNTNYVTVMNRLNRDLANDLIDPPGEGSLREIHVDDFIKELRESIEEEKGEEGEED